MADEKKEKVYYPTPEEKAAIKEGLKAKESGKTWTQEEAFEIIRQSREHWKKLLSQ